MQKLQDELQEGGKLRWNGHVQGRDKENVFKKVERI